MAIRTPFAPHLQPMRRGGVLSRPICRTLPVISCRAAPTCAAARHDLHPQRRGTLAPPYRIFVGDDAPIAPYAPLLAKTLSLRGAKRHGNPYSLRAASHHYISVGRGDCPPSCQPVSAHCRGRQSGHFLETASLLPPPAALRRFPRPPMRCGIGKTGGAEPPPLHNFKKIRRQAPKLSVFNFPLSTYLIPRPISRFFRT